MMTLPELIFKAYWKIFDLCAFERKAAEEVMEGKDEVLGQDIDDMIESDEE